MMLKTLVAAVMTGTASQALAQDVRVSISGEVAPGVYGRVDIGSGPRPPLVSEQPVVVVRQARSLGPVYLHVPGTRRTGPSTARSTMPAADRCTS